MRAKGGPEGLRQQIGHLDTTRFMTNTFRFPTNIRLNTQSRLMDVVILFGLFVSAVADGLSARNSDLRRDFASFNALFQN